MIKIAKSPLKSDEGVLDRIHVLHYIAFRASKERLFAEMKKKQLFTYTQIHVGVAIGLSMQPFRSWYGSDIATNICDQLDADELNTLLGKLRESFGEDSVLIEEYNDVEEQIVAQCVSEKVANKIRNRQLGEERRK